MKKQQYNQIYAFPAAKLQISSVKLVFHLKKRVKILRYIMRHMLSIFVIMTYVEIKYNRSQRIN